MPKFLTLRGFFSLIWVAQQRTSASRSPSPPRVPPREMPRTTLTATTSPVAFLTLRSLRKKYQKRDLATTSLGAKILMR